MPDFPPNFQNPLVYLGLDLGQARCGLGVAAAPDTAEQLGPAIATPAGVVATQPVDSLAQRIQLSLAQRRPVALICGLPLDARGAEGASALAVRELALRLQRELSALYAAAATLPLHFVDERFSTAAALAARRAQPAAAAKRGKARHVPARELRTGIDADVAAELLQGWLDRGAR